MPIPTQVALLAQLGIDGLKMSFGLNDMAPEKYVCYVALALVASALRVAKSNMPGGTSMAFLFILVSLIELSAGQTLLLGGVAILIASPIQADRRNRLLLTLSDLLAVGAGTLAAHWAYGHAFFSNANLIEPSVRYVAASAACFIAMAFPAFLIVGLTTAARDRAGFGYSLLSTAPYYLLSGAVTGMFAQSLPAIGWQFLALYLPVAILLWYSYRLYLRRLETHRERRKEIEGLHMRTIETLALAIGARDQEMSRHLERVQVYAVEMGRAMGLNANEIEGLKAASLLHDIGKLGVPEHIISKPGRLTPEEFEKMKVHPAIGAEILARANFPYPVVPCVRHHHERWDGSGYPDGLKGDSIPIGARILTVVDCLDALASDRQYRRALPIEKAVEQVAAGSGKQFDPKIIAKLKKHYRSWERLVARARSAKSLEEPQSLPQQLFDGVVRTIGSTTAEVNSMFELTQELGNSLNLPEIFQTLGAGLKRLVPYTAMAVYLPRRGALHARHMMGHFPSTPNAIELPIGDGVSGLVATSGIPIVNGHPSHETTDSLLSIYFDGFQSALSIAIPGPDSIAGVLTLYHSEAEFFSTEHLRKVQALIPKLSQAMANGMRFKQAEDKAGTDHLTGLPNAHSLYLHLEHELGLSQCMSSPMAIIVCDLNGFKLVNDTLGHLVGNKLLQAVGVALRECCREYDFVARMGGDEFVMVLSGVSEADAVNKIRELRELIRSSSASVCREGMIAGSFGLAVFPRDAQSADELLAHADRNMYRDKEDQKAFNAPAFGGMRAWKPPVAAISSRTRPSSPSSSLSLSPDKGSRV